MGGEFISNPPFMKKLATLVAAVATTTSTSRTAYAFTHLGILLTRDDLDEATPETHVHKN